MVSRWLQGNTLPVKYLEAIAGYLDVSIGELFRDDAETGLSSPLRDLTQEEWLRGLAKSLGYTIRKARAED